MRRITVPVAFVLAAALAACGDGNGGAPTSSTAPTVSAETTTAVPTTAPPTTVPPPAAPATTAPPEATTTSTTAPGDLPGQPIDFGPAADDEVAVIGVAHDDVLNLRAGPGPDQEILTGIPPLDDSLTARGQTRDIGTAFWILLSHDGTEGWVNLRYIGYLGETTDETAAVQRRIGLPEAETMERLGMIVAESFTSEEPESDIILTVAPTVGDLGEVTYDVIGLGDDALRGFRVHVFGDPVSGGFALSNVEVTYLCGRGVTDDRSCI